MKKQDGRKNNGGVRPNSGRPKKIHEENANKIIRAAIRKITNIDEDEEAQIQYLVDWDTEDPRGAKKFINEHAHGKPKERVDITTDDESVNNSFDLSKLSPDELKLFMRLMSVIND